MPTRPKSACPRCRRLNCICDQEPTKYRARKRKQESGWHRKTNPRPRPGLQTAQEKRRRKDAVLEHLATYGRWCPLCNRHGVFLEADHYPPASEAGEGGPLRVICRECNRKLGSQQGHKLRRLQYGGPAKR